jgi:hypothetical protein
MTAQPWEPRLAHLEGAFEGFEKRFGDLIQNLDARFAQVDARFAQVDARFVQVDARLDRLERKVDSHFQWLVGLIVISILVPLVTKFLGR